MKDTPKNFSICLCTTILLLSTNSWGADFTLNIPINFTKLHNEITKISMKCEIFPRYGSGAQPRSRTNYHPVTEGAVNKTVTFAFSVEIPRDYQNYRCQARLCTENNHCSNLVHGSSDPIFDALPGSTVRITSSGSL